MEYLIGNIDSKETGIIYKIKWNSEDGSIWICQSHQLNWFFIGKVQSKEEVINFVSLFLKSQSGSF